MWQLTGEEAGCLFGSDLPQPAQLVQESVSSCILTAQQSREAVKAEHAFLPAEGQLADLSSHSW